MSKPLQSHPDLDSRMDFFLEALKAVLTLYKQFSGTMAARLAEQHHRELEELIQSFESDRTMANLDRALVACRQALTNQAYLGKAELQRRTTEAQHAGQLLARHLVVLIEDNRAILRDLEGYGEALTAGAREGSDVENIRSCVLHQTDLLRGTIDRQRRRYEFNTQQMSAQVSILTASSSRRGRSLKTDPVTGAGKREAFERQLEERIEDEAAGRFAILLWDVDGLQSVNERFGPLVGDCVLQNQVKQCQRMIRGGDYLGRLVDDAFAVILDDVDESLAIRRGQEIVRKLSTLSNTFSDGLDQHELMVSVSMGIAEYTRGDSAETLLAKAELALGQAKRQGAGTLASFEAVRSETDS